MMTITEAALQAWEPSPPGVKCPFTSSELAHLYDPTAKWDAEFISRYESTPLDICPGCGYGTRASGIVLVTRPDLIIEASDPRLCRDCNPNQVGRRHPDDPPSSELFP